MQAEYVEYRLARITRCWHLRPERFDDPGLAERFGRAIRATALRYQRQHPAWVAMQGGVVLTRDYAADTLDPERVAVVSAVPVMPFVKPEHRAHAQKIAGSYHPGMGDVVAWWHTGEGDL